MRRGSPFEYVLEAPAQRLQGFEYIYIYIHQDPWPVKCISIRTISLSIKCNALFWTKDLASAYYNGKFVGMLLPCPRCHALGAGPPTSGAELCPPEITTFWLRPGVVRWYL